MQKKIMKLHKINVRTYITENSHLYALNTTNCSFTQLLE